MDKKVSESVVGQDEPKPTRDERDAAYSSDAGRKAVEIPVGEQKSINQQDAALGTLSEEGTDISEIAASSKPSNAPLGTELETRAHEFEE